MADSARLSSLELRWFLPGAVSGHATLKRWFETAAWFGRAGVAPRWRGRSDGEPDRYLLLPGAQDMSIKWREGEFQVKGRAAELGRRYFCDRYAGSIEHWIKWSYPALAWEWQSLFQGRTLPVAAVAKSRALRKLRFDPLGGEPAEVHEDDVVERGLIAELTEVAIGDERWSTLGFEAFPADSAMAGQFATVADAVLRTLEESDPKGTLKLDLEQSLSYPAWLSKQGAPSR